MNKTNNGKVFKITEEQYKRALEEGINISGGDGTIDVKTDTVDGQTTVTPKSANPSDPMQVTFDNQNSSMSESRLITKKQFLEDRRKRLKESSEVISVSSLLK